MAFDKTALVERSPKSLTDLVGKRIGAAEAYQHGSVTVVELAFDDSTAGFIKVGPNNSLEIGGTAEVGTGTKVSW